MWVTKKVFTRAAAKNFLYRFTLIFYIKFTLKKLLLKHFYWLKNKAPYPLLFEEKKRKFVQINLLVELFFVFACVFLKKNIYTLIQIRLMLASR